MFRSSFAVVSGYFVMALLVMPVFGLVYLAPDFVFEEGQARATLTFSILTLVCGFVGAFVGGFVAVVVSRGRSAPVTALAAIVLGVGLASGIHNALAEAPPALTPEQVAELTIRERAERSREPVWYGFTTPIVGALAVALGGRRRRRAGERAVSPESLEDSSL